VNENEINLIPPTACQVDLLFREMPVEAVYMQEVQVTVLCELFYEEA
jgi:hypothetical protein